MTIIKNKRIYKKKKRSSSEEEHNDFGAHEPPTLDTYVKQRAIDRRRYRLRAPNIQNINDPLKDATLYDALNASYSGTLFGGNSKDSIEAITNKGYVYDPDISNNHLKVFYHPKNEKLLYSVAGSHDLYDFLVVDPLYLATGNISNTHRFQEAEAGLKAAKSKYKPKNTTVTGHSLGATIAQKIAHIDDRIITYNKFARPGQHNERNELSIRHAWDWFSSFVQNDKNTRTIQTHKGFNLLGQGLIDPVSSHSLNTLKKASFVV